MAFLWNATSIDCPVEECPGRETICTNLQLHFMLWHMEDTIVILKDGLGPHPWCYNCNMFINQDAMAAEHLGTTICKSGVKRNHHHIAATAAQITAGTDFQAQDQVLEKLDTFNYLDMMLSFYDRDWPVVNWNLHKYWIKWGRLSCMLCQKGG